MKEKDTYKKNILSLETEAGKFLRLGEHRDKEGQQNETTKNPEQTKNVPNSKRLKFFT